ncbi:TPA: hydrogenase formation protein HypD [Candidatus Woesearchaeota archaeon]|nr:hydrogenase formation protein HypD [Candidatus Woesearchaeota archaeon]
MTDYISMIRKLAADLPYTKIMEVCGGHTHTIMKYGLHDILPENVKLVAGPGCPVCVTSQHDIDCVIELAKNGIPITTYGDMLHVPGTKMSLDDARSRGANIRMVLSATEALDYPDHVFFGIGFETTTPMTAFLLKKGLTVYSTHKVMPPPMRILAESDSEIRGFIDPGHVSAITGTALWESLDVPQVVCGFKPEQMIRAICKLLTLIKEKDPSVINDYPEVVRPEGNTKALQLIEDTMKPVDADWRGFGSIPDSGLDPLDDDLNAKLVYQDLLSGIESRENPGCRCSEVIRGLIEPDNCPLFGKACTPDSPQGACMVSQNEAACAIYYRYRR